MSEPREFELKLELDPEAIGKIRSHPFFRSESAETKTLDSTYFDTPKLALRDAGIALRIRRDGSRFIRTIKAERARSGVALDRSEWEEEVASPVLDPDTPAPEPLQSAIGGKSLRRLKPVFTVCTERVVSTIEHAGAGIELALDSVRIDANGKQIGFGEVELELKSGRPSSLFAVAAELAHDFPVRLSTRSKSDRGYALLQSKPAKAVKARPIELRAEDTTAVAFQMICSACLRQLIGNEAVLRDRPNPDAIHQARVAVRRLRAALSLFGDVVADDQTDAVKSELKWIAEQLGQARDLDVFITKALEPGAKKLGGPEWRKLLKDFRKRRDDAYARAVEAIGSERYRRAVLAAAIWIESGPWLEEAREGSSDPRDQPIDGFAKAELERRWRKTRVRLKGIEKLDEDTRHRVRIEMKKLRYAAEFFSSLFQAPGTDKPFREAMKALEGLQATLGDLNDIAVGRAIASSAAADLPGRLRDPEVKPLLSQAKVQAKQFRGLEAFWR